ncbi:MAG: hypothetical protein OQL16_10485 [Gammaproteobacteria bacterium]|nr:hypothetical protein [Gammaproteobacteria bacterium]
MIHRYIRLRKFCQKNDWAAGLSAFLLICLLGAVIYGALENQSIVLHWLGHAVLINGLILVAIILAIGALSMSLFCLSFSDSSIEDRTERVIHRNRPVMAGSLKIVKNLGVNPKRRRTPDRSASA